MESVFVPQSTTPSPVRPSWCRRVVGHLQVATGALELLEAESARAALIHTVGSMLPPNTRLEEALLRGMLLEFATRSGERMHRQICDAGSGCPFVAASLLWKFWNGRQSARDAFTGWIEAFVVDLRVAHRLSPAARVAHLIRADHHVTRTVTDYAREVHSSPSALRRRFQKQFGMSIGHYRRIVRERWKS